jgi:uncharacterized protein
VTDFPHQVGLISDTHGLMRPEALNALCGSELIIHAGDIGAPSVLEALQKLAPVRAIRGNIDQADWAARLPAWDLVEVGPHSLYVLHNLAELDLDAVVTGASVVVSGHSHKPSVQKRGKILFVNPGSAGPRRFKLPVTVARLTLRTHACEAKIVPLATPQPNRR